MPIQRSRSVDGDTEATPLSNAKNNLNNQQPTKAAEEVKHYSASTQLQHAMSGAISGCFTRTLTQPFDVLKIRFQLQVEPVKSGAPHINSKYTSLLQACRLIYRDEGLLAFWKGHNAGQFNSILYALVQFWSFEQLHMGVSQLPWMHRHEYANNFVSGGLAGCVATCISMPFDVIRTRVVAQDHGTGYKSTLHAFPTIMHSEGVSGLFRGLGTTLIQIGPLVGLNFMFYHVCNDFAAKVLDKPSSTNLPTWILLCNGGFAGVASKALVYPLDFIKKRLQLRGFEHQRQTYGQNQSCQNIGHCIRLTIQNEGLLGFYKGMTPTLFKSGMTTALYFSFYDKFKLLFEGESVSS